MKYQVTLSKKQFCDFVKSEGYINLEMEKNLNGSVTLRTTSENKEYILFREIRKEDKEGPSRIEIWKYTITNPNVRIYENVYGNVYLCHYVKSEGYINLEMEKNLNGSVTLRTTSENKEYILFREVRKEDKEGPPRIEIWKYSITNPNVRIYENVYGNVYLCHYEVYLR